MEKLTADAYRNRVETALQKLWLSIRTQSSSETLLNSFWTLQDELSRLLQATTESPWLATQYPGLATRILNELKAVNTLKIASLPAIAASCNSINESLIRLESAKQQFRSAAVN
jgi:hypothetical protein